VVTRQPQVEPRTAKVRLSETDVLSLCHATYGETQTMFHIVKSCPDKTEWRLISATFCGWRRC